MVRRSAAQAGNRLRRRGLVSLRTAAGADPLVLVRDPSGEREPEAFLSTDLTAKPEQILGWFVSRWRMETTFQETRTHLGVETQRQWSDLAILRTTPALLALFSLVTVWANWMVRIPIDLRSVLSAREPPHGTTSATRRSAMPSPPFDALSGIRQICACLGKPRRSSKSLQPCCKESPRLKLNSSPRCSER